jgi:hypothetical protein
MDILAKARQLEARLARRVDRAAGRALPRTGREPLEIAHAVVEAVEREIQPAGRGRHLFPFNRIRVAVLAPTPQTRARVEAVFATEPTLAERITSRLEAAGCRVDDLAIHVECATQTGTGWETPDLHVEFERVSTVAPVELPAPVAVTPVVEPPAIEIEVVAGAADEPRFTFRLTRIDLGRCAEVRDQRSRLLRTNHVAFSDNGERPNTTVSRRHAHVAFDAAAEEFRVFDDGSEQGTSLMRSGKTIVIPTGARGVRLLSGDEVVLGQARVRVKF